ncbi:MAG: trigger factor [Chromatiales bacterium]|nr:trigger factor [Chromatiales bacterium]
MQVSIETSAGLERRMRVQVPAETVEKEVESRLKSVGRSAQIKGFRPGKVPDKVIRQRYGGHVRQEVLQDILQSSYSEAVVQEKLRPAGGPSIEPESVEEGKDLTYIAIFEVYPEFELKGLNSIKIEESKVEIEDPDIDRMIENLRKQRAHWHDVDRKAAEGDQVTLDFDGTLKGEPFEGGSAKDFSVVLGDGAMLEDFEKNLAGVAAGDEKSFRMKFPKDYHAEALAGQKVEFAIKVAKVAEQHLPDLDEEFIKAYGVESGGEEELRVDIRANMQRELDAKCKAEIKKQILDGLLKQNPVELPDVLVRQECDALQKEAMQQLGIAEPEQAPAPESFRETAEKRVRLGLLMTEYISSNELELNRDRVTAKVDEMCAPYENPDEIRNIYLQNPQFLGQIENMVLEEQVIEGLAEHAKVSQKKKGFTELMEMPA